VVVAGLGTGGGTGASVARRFAKSGYKVALIARGADALKKLSTEINESGGSAEAFVISTYSYTEVHGVFTAIKKKWPGDLIRVTVWNAGDASWKGFLEITEEDLKKTTDTITGAFAFSRESILAFQDQELDEQGARGTLIYTGATASIRGNVITSAFSSGKFALRALSQSLAKEFGKKNIHVAHAIIDGSISTDRNAGEGTSDSKLHPDAIAQAYEFIANQHRSAWTWELDLRPSHEKF